MCVIAAQQGVTKFWLVTSLISKTFIFMLGIVFDLVVFLPLAFTFYDCFHDVVSMSLSSVQAVNYMKTLVTLWHTVLVRH